jgi:hypothetical protein
MKENVSHPLKYLVLPLQSSASPRCPKPVTQRTRLCVRIDRLPREPTEFYILSAERRRRDTLVPAKPIQQTEELDVITDPE